jgi:hypothetical protein
MIKRGGVLHVYIMEDSSIYGMNSDLVKQIKVRSSITTVLHRSGLVDVKTGMRAGRGQWSRV